MICFYTIMIREKLLKIDYEKTGYEEVWEGIFEDG